MKYLPGIILLLLFMSGDIMAQSDSVIYQIETLDGNIYLGTIESQDSESVVLRTEELGVITLKRSIIKKLEVVDPKRIIKGKLWEENPQETRYFWQPNGYGLKHKEGYYQNVWIFFNQFTYGLSDNFSVGLGLVPLFLFAGAPTPVWVTGKFSIPVTEEKFNVGGGILAGTVIGEEGTGFGILYGLSTFGSRDANATLGLGYGYTGEGISNRPVISLSGMVRTGRKGYLLTENYFISTEYELMVFVLLGGRSILKSVGIDYGLIFTTNDFIAIPWLGLTVPF